MARARQICSICYREFTRKSNAERHNENLHASQAHIIPLGEFRFGGSGPHVRNKVGFSSTTNGHTKEEDLLNDVFQRIGKDFEGCEHELMMFSHHDRAECLSLVILCALRSDPRQTMRAFLKGLKRINLGLKMIGTVATGLGLPYNAAKQLLINTLK